MKKSTIPKRIFTFWFDEKNKVPKYIEKYIKTQKIPGYEHRLITLENCFKNSLYVQQCIKSKHKKIKWAKLADYLRLHYLYTEGGIYLDADIEMRPRKNFNDLLGEQMFMGIEAFTSPVALIIGTAVVGAKKRHPFIKALMDKMVKNFRGDDDRCYESGMDLLNREGVYYQDKFKLLPPEVFYPYSNITKEVNITKNSICVHHFNMSWVEKLPLVSIILPQLGRPAGLKRCLESITKLNYPKELIELFVIEGDKTVPEKVQEGLKKCKGDIICYAANDIEFTPDSLMLAVKMSKDYGLVAFNTGELLPDKGNCCEHFIITKELIAKIGGKIFDTDFHHVSVDNLLYAQASALNQYTRCEQAVVNHYHFSRGGKMDDVYKKGWSHVEKDRALLKKKLKQKVFSF